MSRYLSSLCESLTTVLDFASTQSRARLAGHFANLEFWLVEVQHRLNAIDGWADRRRKMADATSAAFIAESAREAAMRPFVPINRLGLPQTPDVTTDWEQLEKEAEQLRTRVLKSWKRFLKRCLNEGFLTNDQLFEREDRMNLNLRDS